MLIRQAAGIIKYSYKLCGESLRLKMNELASTLPEYQLLWI